MTKKDDGKDLGLEKLTDEKLVGMLLTEDGQVFFLSQVEVWSWQAGMDHLTRVSGGELDSHGPAYIASFLTGRGDSVAFVYGRTRKEIWAGPISNLKVVLCAQSSARVDRLEVFLRERLDLKVMRMSPEAHDSEMAYVQGLTHWIAKALREIKLPDLDLSTPAYRYLIRIEEILREDSDALFRTIQAENPFAAEARAELMEKLREIEDSIS